VLVVAVVVTPGFLGQLQMPHLTSTLIHPLVLEMRALLVQEMAPGALLVLPERRARLRLPELRALREADVRLATQAAPHQTLGLDQLEQRVPPEAQQ
jgi:hypothetical protein